jgi:hypothetical protein
LKGASTSRTVRAVCSASSATIPWLFLENTRNAPSGVRIAVHARPWSVRAMWKPVSCSVGELKPPAAICSATSLGSSRTVPPDGSARMPA